MKKIYGVFECNEYGGANLVAPLYTHLKDAMQAAEKLVEEKQKETTHMQEYLRDSQRDSYKDWKKKSDYGWEGGYLYTNTIEILKLDLV